VLDRVFVLKLTAHPLLCQIEQELQEKYIF